MASLILLVAEPRANAHDRPFGHMVSRVNTPHATFLSQCWRNYLSCQQYFNKLRTPVNFSTCTDVEKAIEQNLEKNDPCKLGA
jgi:hypothetical protein